MSEYHEFKRGDFFKRRLARTNRYIGVGEIISVYRAYSNFPACYLVKLNGEQDILPGGCMEPLSDLEALIYISEIDDEKG